MEKEAQGLVGWGKDGQNLICWDIRGRGMKIAAKIFLYKPQSELVIVASQHV